MTNDVLLVEERRRFLRPPPIAITLWRGPSHVLVDANETVRELIGDGGFGIPVREFFVSEHWAGLHATMDEVFRDGRTRYSQSPTGNILIVAPWTDPEGRRAGVGTWSRLEPGYPVALLRSLVPASA